MKARHPNRELAFLINDVGRLLRTYGDREARRYGATRAQWVLLVSLERNEGMKQSELADMLDIQPITLTRLVDRLCENGLIERRPDPEDRRAKRLYLTSAARPVLDHLDVLGRNLMEPVLEGVDAQSNALVRAQLGIMKENLRTILQNKPDPGLEAKKRYG